MVRSLALVAALFASAAFADSARISILPFKGAKAEAVRTQLSKSLCEQFTCVQPGAGEDVEVDAVVTGELKAGKKLKVAVYYDEDAKPVTRKLGVAKGKVKAPAMDQVAAAVKQAVDQKATKMASVE